MTDSYHYSPQKPPVCPCRCVRNDPLPSSLTSKQLRDKATSQIFRDLHVPANVTGKAIRKRNSANDDRTSASAAGLVSVVMMVAVLLSVTLPDCVTLVTYLERVWNRDKNA
ncbi:hypothetical protein BaRGS_00034928 [Batillaria attramentaria]|uniref:Uncharacterized protein n=1 Tax=Batillaria attramentaria TaxID=370345 RepID=A0ABD0JGS0_9CAEN